MTRGGMSDYQMSKLGPLSVTDGLTLTIHYLSLFSLPVKSRCSHGTKTKPKRLFDSLDLRIKGKFAQQIVHLPRIRVPITMVGEYAYYGMPQAGVSTIRENSVFFFHHGLMVFFYCAISLALDIVFFYCAISLAPVQLGITCNAEVTQNGPHANSKFYIFLVATLMQEVSCHKLVF